MREGRCAAGRPRPAATIGDLLTKEVGLNLGAVGPSIVLLAIFLLLALFVGMYRRREGQAGTG